MMNAFSRYILSAAVVSLLVLTLVPLLNNAAMLRYTQNTGLATVDVSFVGENSNDFTGFGASIAGDVNGDGLDDLLISGHKYNGGGTDRGKIYLVHGHNSLWGKDAPLSSVNGSFVGEADHDKAGWSVDGAGDVNGDGYDDILIGAPEHNHNLAADSGKVYLFFGKPGSFGTNINLSTADATFTGEAPGDAAGKSVNGAGDLNGDGYDDIIIAAPSCDVPSKTDAGKVYVIFGGENKWSTDVDLTDADVEIDGAVQDGYFGISMDGGKDVNGDGFDDFIVGASSDAHNLTEQGKAYVFHGRKVWEDSFTALQANESIAGEKSLDHFGNSVALLEDVTGDGRDDIMASASLFDSAQNVDCGKVYFFKSKAGGLGENISAASADAFFLGEKVGDKLGEAISTTGDCDGDGYGDMLIGAHNYTDGSTKQGKAYFFRSNGGSGFNSGNVSAVKTCSFLGEDTYNYAGCTLSGDGDMNGDGFDDAIIAANYYTAGIGKVYLVYPYLNSPPSSVLYIKAFSDAGYSNQINEANMEDTVHIELSGQDSSSSTVDIAVAHVTSTDDAAGYRMRLKETGTNTGVYRGALKFANRTRECDDWIGTSTGGAVTIEHTTDTSTNITISVTGKVKVQPPTDILTATEDSLYSSLYYTTGVASSSWNFMTNGGEWLSFNPATGNLSGTPDNRHSGSSYFVSLNATEDGGPTWDLRYFQIFVENVAPDVNITFNSSAYEDMPWSVDYDSTDDGQGFVTWHLESGAPSWLTMNATTGVLSGTPAQTDQGSYLINVWVDDGAGGITWSNHSLTVYTVNDAPVMNGTGVTTAQEDSAYYCNFTATDPDSPDLTWKLHTDAGWLSNTGGNLQGTPYQADVGTYWVNLTVSDGAGGLDFDHFTITVINVNDPPVFTKTPNATEDAEVNAPFTFQAAAEDEDGDDVTYSISSNPVSSIGVDADTGLIEWTPESPGTFVVTLKATDGELAIEYIFTIEVEGSIANGPPEFTSSPQLSVSVQGVWMYTIETEDPDGDDVTLTLAKGPTLMTLVGNVLMWTPLSEGTYEVSIRAEDEHHTVYQNFTISVGSGTVVPHVNRAPVVQTIPDQKVSAGDDFTYQVEASDPDGGELVYEVQEGPDGMGVDSTGYILWSTDNADAGTHHIVISVSDDNGSKTTVAFDIIVEEVSGFSTAMSAALFIGLIAIILVVIIAVIIIIVILKSKKKQRPAAEDAEEPSRPPPGDPAVEAGMAYPEGPTEQAAREPWTGQDTVPPVDAVPEMGIEEPQELPGEGPDTPAPLLDTQLGDLQPLTEGAQAGPGRKKPIDLPALPPARILDVPDDPLENIPFNEVMVMTTDGLLVEHYARNPDDELDRDILSGMLTAVQGFVKDSFANRDATIRRLEMQDFTLLIEPGKYINLVGITQDRQNRELEDHLKRMMREVEREMGQILDHWDGSIDDIKGIEVYITKLLEGGYED